MRTLFYDSDFKVHINNPEGAYTAIETDFFDGMCDVYVEGYRFIPFGESWTRSDSVVFHGEMIAPWKPYVELAAAQVQYETDQAELMIAYQEGVNSV